MTITQIHQLFTKSNGVCTDTRKLKKGQLFIALKGDNFNGNQYAIKALEKGASYAIIDDNSIKHPKAIIVNNSLTALQELAKFHRNYLNIPIIALTGSNGKTTTKELIHIVLSTQYNCVSTKGNLNNHIGVPLTLLSMDKSTEIGVVEMGANHMEEIAELSQIAQPKEKENTIQIKPLDTHNFISISLEGIEINSKLIGSYNFTNIAAAISIGKHLKIEVKNIKAAIENYIPENNRSELTTKGSNDIILDAYNANPSSMKAAIENFIITKTNKNQKIAILGDMFELGAYALKEHQYLVDYVTNSNIDHILLSGNHFSECDINSKKISLFEDSKSLILHLEKHPITNSLLLIKGSRGMKLEQTLHTFE